MKQVDLSRRNTQLAVASLFSWPPGSTPQGPIYLSTPQIVPPLACIFSIPAKGPTRTIIPLRKSLTPLIHPSVGTLIAATMPPGCLPASAPPILIPMDLASATTMDPASSTHARPQVPQSPPCTHAMTWLSPQCVPSPVTPCSSPLATLQELPARTASGAWELTAFGQRCWLIHQAVLTAN